jgi:hypothetical protein
LPISSITYDLKPFDTAEQRPHTIADKRVVINNE